MRALVRPDKFDRYVSVLVFVPARPLRQRRARSGSASLSRRSLRGPAVGVLPGVSRRRCRWPASTSSSGAPAARRRCAAQADLEAGIAALIVAHGATSSATCCLPARTTAADGAARAAITTPFPPPTATTSPPAAARRRHRRLRTACRTRARSTSPSTAAQRGDRARSACKLDPPRRRRSRCRERVPMLENMGFRVIDERTYEITARRAAPPMLRPRHGAGKRADGARGRSRAPAEQLTACLLAVWDGRAENDGYNALVLSAGLDWRDAALLSACRATCGRPAFRTRSTTWRRRSIAIPKHRGRAGARCSAPVSIPNDRRRSAPTASARRRSRRRSKSVDSLDEDRIIRRFANRHRTRWCAPTSSRPMPTAQPAAEISFKLDSRDGRRAAGAAAVPRDLRAFAARRRRAPALRQGGARRHPLVGPAAGFPHRDPRPGQGAAGQERRHRAGRRQGRLRRRSSCPPVPAATRCWPRATAAYRIFIASLLAITDNLDGETVVPPAACRAPRRRRSVFRGRRRQGHGDLLRHRQRASRSEARLLARRRLRQRRLGRLRPQEDGDHRARRLGGGQAPFPRDRRRHPDDAVHRRRRRRHVGRRVRQRHAAVAGDEAGRRLRPSRHLHRSRSRSGRRALPNASACSSCRGRAGRTTTRQRFPTGGGVFSRREKSIRLQPRDQDRARPDARPRNAGRSDRAPSSRPRSTCCGSAASAPTSRRPAKATSEVGDRANDAIRITADAIGARVVGEGANLAMTQRARIDYGLAGGRCNSDAIDNSAGVNTSDVEVNIKIALPQGACAKAASTCAGATGCSSR